MSNQRSKNKAHLGGYIHRKFHREITRLAKKEGMEFNRFGFVERLMREAVARRKKRSNHSKR